MKWFQIKEKSANKKGLAICWILYNLFGEFPVKIVAFLVALSTFILNSDLRKYLHDYFHVIYQYTNDKKLRPSILNSFKNVLNYAYSLADKMIVFGGKYNPDKISFNSPDDKTEFMKNIENKKGILFICNHIGNIEVMRSLLDSNKYLKVPSVSVFMNETHCKIFNDFISNLTQIPDNLKIYPVENIDMNDAINLESDLSNGGIAFLAGDRISESNPNQVYQAKLFDKTVQLPKGVFRLAKSLSAKIYFASCINCGNGYKIFIKKCENKTQSSTIKDEFVKFLEDITLTYPHQFYHFCDYFEEEL